MLLKVEIIITNYNCTKLFFVGSKFEITYNYKLGLYEKVEYINNYSKDDVCGIKFDDLICVEPLIYCRIANKDFFYFKSAPLEYF